jgi:hypothetical protein
MCNNYMIFFTLVVLWMQDFSHVRGVCAGSFVVILFTEKNYKCVIYENGVNI